MDALATRVLTYLHDSGKEIDITLTVSVPVLTDRGDWKCEFQLRPPDTRRAVHVYGFDFIQALLGCLEVARDYVEHPTEDRTCWQGMSHAGLPGRQAKPEGYQPPSVPKPEKRPGSLEVLTTSRLSVPRGNNDVRELLLVVYTPFRAPDGAWRCAFAFGPSADEPVLYGFGADFIESLLDALAMARVAYEAADTATHGPSDPDKIESAWFLPYKVGRAYFIEPARGSEFVQNHVEVPEVKQ